MRLLKFFVFLISFIILERICHKTTEGFQLQKIFSDFCFDSKWTTEPLNPKLEPIFNQSFHFLGSGGQCYAFLSDDQNYVIKFFKQHHMKKLPWLEKLALPAFLDHYKDKILLDRAERSQERIFGSYKIAYEHLKEETALLYLHLNKTSTLHKKLVIYDKLGIRHEIDLDTTEFALQKRATLAYPHLRSLVKQKKLSEAKECLRSLFELLTKRIKLGIIDQDPAFRKNFGFINTQAVEIDLGSFSWNSEQMDADYCQRVLLEETIDLKKWLAKRCPQLIDYFNEQLDETFEIH